MVVQKRGERSAGIGRGGFPKVFHWRADVAARVSTAHLYTYGRNIPLVLLHAHKSHWFAANQLSQPSSQDEPSVNHTAPMSATADFTLALAGGEVGVHAARQSDSKVPATVLIGRRPPKSSYKNLLRVDFCATCGRSGVGSRESQHSHLPASRSSGSDTIAITLGCCCRCSRNTAVEGGIA